MMPWILTVLVKGQRKKLCQSFPNRSLLRCLITCPAYLLTAGALTGVLWTQGLKTHRGILYSQRQGQSRPSSWAQSSWLAAAKWCLELWWISLPFSLRGASSFPKSRGEGGETKTAAGRLLLLFSPGMVPPTPQTVRGEETSLELQLTLVPLPLCMSDPVL